MNTNEITMLHDVLQGNRDAVHLCHILTDLSHIWDDLVDRDKPVDNAAINRAFWGALILVNENSFFIQNREHLLPVMRRWVNNWLTANTFEARGTGQDYHVSFILRNRLTDVILEMAYLIGGYEWQRRVSLVLESFQYTETFEEYVSELQGV
ncbi:hypothetical protein [Desulfovibrio inopinatus]|uniref:hypothetical protein n=1 Tax=Desulfovibrio inopinatus TaxID=102109 RepID=UPI0004117589|nr:hypothetical protein [Desulfovibrio inopinatus]